MLRRTFVLGLALAVTAGCSSSTKGSSGSRSNSNLLTRQELSTANVDNAFDAVQRLRPAFLRARTIAGSGQTSSGATVVQGLPEVFVDGLRKGSPDYLRTIPTREVAEIRYLSAIDATTRYGMNVPAGVIDVKLIGR